MQKKASEAGLDLNSRHLVIARNLVGTASSQTRIFSDLLFFSTSGLGARQPCLLIPILLLPLSPALARRPQFRPKKTFDKFEFWPDVWLLSRDLQP